MRFTLPHATSRLWFRWWRADDLELARSLWGDPRVTERIGQIEPAVRLAAELELAREHGVQYWPVFYGESHVGCCGLRPRSAGVLELGFHLRPEHWGQGFATEAAIAVIDHAFGVLGAAKLFAGHHPANAASRRTLEKLSFRYTHHERYPATGALHPSYELQRPGRQ